MKIEPSAEQLRQKLGLTKSPVVDSGLHTTLVFFEKELGIAAEDWLRYLRGIDFHSPVKMVTIAPGKTLVRHAWTLATNILKSDIPAKSASKPFLYFTDPGESPMRTGTNFANVTFQRAYVQSPMRVLKSTASSISFSPFDDVSRSVSLVQFDHVSRPGGAVQYIIAARNLSALRFEQVR